MFRELANRRSLSGATLLIAVFLAGSAAGTSAATIVVNDDSSTLHDTGCAATGTGACTLSDAIAFANANTGADEIHFAIPGDGVHTITGSFSITDAVTIDGYTQPGSSVNTNGPGLGDNAVLRVEIAGCIDVSNGPTTIRGLVINSCPAAGLSNAAGIHVVGGYLRPNYLTRIEGNFIGTDATGTIGKPNYVGVYLEPCETIVGTSLTDSPLRAAAARNVISGNAIGVESVPGPHLIAGNFIGTDASGTKAIPNGEGIQVLQNTIGDCAGKSVTNLFGIGGPGISLRNVISGNQGGINIDDGGTHVQGNFIGTDVSGTVAVPNAGGISIYVSGDVGGDEPGAGNLISGNGNGVGLDSGGDVRRNRIGTDLTGKMPLGNESFGVHVDHYGSVVDNLVAFNGAKDPNGGGIVAIAGGFPQVSVSMSGNIVLGNRSDGTVPDRGLGIDLSESESFDADGPTPNDDCDVDELQNKPLLLGATTSSGGTRIRGVLDSKPSKTFRIEFFSNAACDSSGSGPGEVFLGSVDMSTDDTCIGVFDATLPVSVPESRLITATATELSSQQTPLQTSELSACIAPLPVELDVNSVTPTSGPSEGLADVTIQGRGFLLNAYFSVGGKAFGTKGGFSEDSLRTGTVPALAPGTLNDVAVTNPFSGPATLPHAWFADFSDVPAAHEFHGAVERIFRANITSGCGGGNFCPDNGVTREQVAAFLSRALAGGDASKIPTAGTVYGVPYDCKAGGVSLFSDVATTDPFCKHVHWLAAWKVTLGCSLTQFCPSTPVDRAGMAGLVARALIAPDWMPVPATYGPDPVTGRSYSCDAAAPNVHFTDVPATDAFCKHVHYLWARGVVSGCTEDQYCPALPVTRGPMAKFLANAFVPAAP